MMDAKDKIISFNLKECVGNLKVDIYEDGEVWTKNVSIDFQNEGQDPITISASTSEYQRKDLEPLETMVVAALFSAIEGTGSMDAFLGRFISDFLFKTKAKITVTGGYGLI